MEDIYIFMDTRSNLRQFGIFYGRLVCSEVICSNFFRFGMLYQEKCGNPAADLHLHT
jgi:hypothetical protein